jgi:hypothetical protein
MTAGLNIKGRIWRVSTPTDDDVGGAMVSGTVVYDNLACRLIPQRPNSLLLEQGLEVDGLYLMEIRPPSLDIREQDHFELTFPSYHPEYGHHFRIIGVQRTSMHPADSRGFINLTMKRSRFAHAKQ